MPGVLVGGRVLEGGGGKPRGDPRGWRRNAERNHDGEAGHDKMYPLPVSHSHLPLLLPTITLVPRRR